MGRDLSSDLTRTPSPLSTRSRRSLDYLYKGEVKQAFRQSDGSYLWRELSQATRGLLVRVASGPLGRRLATPLFPPATMSRWRARVLARRGLRRGCQSRDFSLTELAEAVHGDHDENVYLDVDVFSNLTARGGEARAALSARLAPAPPLATAFLCLDQVLSPGALGVLPSPACEPRLRVALQADVVPLQEIFLWFDEHTLAQLDMPFLTLTNITGKRNYSCHECSAEFEHPNSLKIHLFLACRPYEPERFWSQIVRRLRNATPTPARIEALAAAWGRSRAGHVCVYCGKLYSRKYGLKIHIRTHTGYKPLRCRHCARAFGDPSNLNKHVRLHAAHDDAAYACALCGRRLARRRDLQRHLRAHHTETQVDV